MTTFPDWPAPADLDTPVAVVDRDRMDANITRMVLAMRDRGVDLRPHAKTHKSVAVARRQVELGATGITTATLSEAVVMADGGIDDLFVAYPVWPSAARAERLRDLAARVRRFRVGVDSPEAATRLGAAMGTQDLEVLVEVDAGELRTGVTNADRAVAVTRAALEAGLRPVGVFTHGGHGYAGRDHAAPAGQDEVDRLTAAVEALDAAGHPPAVVSAGSTPTALHSARGVVTEERPGTFVFGDRQQVALGAVDPDTTALRVAGTCVSREAPGRFVLDCGAKAVTKDTPATVSGFGTLPGYPDAEVVSMYDHHAVAEIGPSGRAPSLGEVVWMVPNHACPVVNLFDELVVMADGEIVDRWTVDARGRSQ